MNSYEQDECTHDELDHGICIDCGYEEEDGPIYMIEVSDQD